jgi:glycerate 2-kinase
MTRNGVARTTCYYPHEAAGTRSAYESVMNQRESLRSLYQAAVREADPAVVLAAALPEPPRGETVVVGMGKAAAAMAAALEAAWPARLRGAVVVPDGHGVPTRCIEVLEAAHPVPDERSERAARRLLSEVNGLRAEDLVIALISGGGSALCALPAAGVSMTEKQRITGELLRSGASIHEINAVRAHLSAIKGGRLAAAAAPASVVTLAISDVPGDDPAIIASGPTVPNHTTNDEVRAIALRYGIVLPAALSETPRIGDAEVRLIATPAQAIAAAAARARELGYESEDLGIREGESARLGVELARRALVSPSKTALISGGETVVTIGNDAHGRGGRNLELLLALAIELNGAQNVRAVAGDTDGRDGSEPVAGAFVFPDTLARARALGLDAREHLARHDSYTFFEALGDLLVTGPTRTNVNALRAVLVD